VVFRGQRPQSPPKLNKGIEVRWLPPRLVRAERVAPSEVSPPQVAEVPLRRQVNLEFSEASRWRGTG
jgi:hypothetical protein